MKKNSLHISNVGSSSQSNPLLWANIEKDDFFVQFSMDGVDEHFNEIWLTFSPGKKTKKKNEIKSKK